jgi:DtxR family transcriptional regulator, Mn-dependent transcriptional regulator
MTRRSEEDYMKTIYELGSETKETLITNSMIASRMRVTAASATNMIKKLTENELITHEPYRGVQLTEKGTRFALRILRRHRLLELYLVQELGFSWDQVHDEAERLEHVISDTFERKMDEKMGYPSLDPHGAPIPDGNGHIAESTSVCLTDMQPGQSGVVCSVTDKDPAMLRFLEGIGVNLGVHIEMVNKEPFGGSFMIRIGKAQEEPIGQRLANQIFVAMKG